MKTWGAGLAYSNGFRSSEASGYLTYYAERCPDLAATMGFVVGEMAAAPYNPDLAEYAVAQAFAYSRGANSYENRGEAMAAKVSIEKFREVSEWLSKEFPHSSLSKSFLVKTLSIKYLSVGLFMLMLSPHTVLLER
jgi:hypothetical protein